MAPQDITALRRRVGLMCERADDPRRMPSPAAIEHLLAEGYALALAGDGWCARHGADDHQMGVRVDELRADLRRLRAVLHLSAVPQR